MTESFEIRLNRFEKDSLYGKRHKRHFHISKEARKKYNFSKDIFTISGNVIFSDFNSAREFAFKINQIRDTKNNPELSINAGEIYAMGLVDEIFHHIIDIYVSTVSPSLIKDGMVYVNEKTKSLDNTVFTFCEHFPPLPVFEGKIPIAHFLNEKTAEKSNKEIEFEELFVLWLENQNPAFKKYEEFIGDEKIAKKSPYLTVISEFKQFLSKKPGVETGKGSENIIDFLLEPIRRHPNSIMDQLLFMKENWGLVLNDNFFKRILVTEGIVAEENKPNFPFEPKGEVFNPNFYAGFDGDDSSFQDEEYENFSEDRDWMPEVIMIAKNAFVWLDQLSKKYAKPITTIDKIPEDELKELAKSGITALWLIGIWERSSASKKIKHLCGNPDAVASAYSLYDYQIANELGGEKAFYVLEQNAKKYGIKLASDMVPNHTGIDSKWIYEHPEYFISLDYSPFPSYSFNGENLSSNPNIGIFIEDHYYSKEDAAVVFKRVDYSSGETKYIYHGNDGTTMPWNDTAQLNYLNPKVREAVIQTIISIAKKFPIIRFDAAMTLAKRHYQRLWFPKPGTGGDIASRAEHGLSKQEFDKLFPKEFWREVVDRIAIEAPDTLLLAEAFWLMEGYFVRTLGMHRVYNSAFMNFMKDEDNAKYRTSVKNVLEFDPEILQRFVNFLNNPDEKPAVLQFGKGDKYFGVTITMVTMPGLPMFGHGQIEGFSEKYGMEYKKAYWNEAVDFDLVERHKKEVFPLMKKRYLFANVWNFYFYDFITNNVVNENVFAYSNMFKNERAFVVYNNSFERTAGFVFQSVEFLDKKERILKRKSLLDALQINPSQNSFIIFKEHISNKFFIRNSLEISQKGLFIALNGYETQVFLDFEIVENSKENPWQKLCETLNGSGVDDIYEEIFFVKNSEFINAFKQIASKENFQKLFEIRKKCLENKKECKTIELEKELKILIQKFAKKINPDVTKKQSSNYIKSVNLVINKVLTLPKIDFSLYDKEIQQFFKKEISDDKYTLFMMFAWALISNLSLLFEKTSDIEIFEKYKFSRIFSNLFVSIGASEKRADKQVLFVKLFIKYFDFFQKTTKKDLEKKLSELLKEKETKKALQLNKYNGIVWFNKEAFELLFSGLFIVDFILNIKNSKKEVEKKFDILKTIIEVSKKSEYNFEKLTDLIKKSV